RPAPGRLGRAGRSPGSLRTRGWAASPVIRARRSQRSEWAYSRGSRARKEQVHNPGEMHKLQEQGTNYKRIAWWSSPGDKGLTADSPPLMLPWLKSRLAFVIRQRGDRHVLRVEGQKPAQSAVAAELRSPAGPRRWPRAGHTTCRPVWLPEAPEEELWLVVHWRKPEPLLHPRPILDFTGG